MNQSCLTWMSHVSQEWVMSYMNESRHVWTSHVSYEWVMSHVWMSHVTHMNESRLHRVPCCVFSDTRTVLHPWMSHVSHEWVMSQMNESCHLPPSPPHRNESRLTWMSHISHEWVMSQVNESCHKRMSHVSYKKRVMSPFPHSTRCRVHCLIYEWITSRTNESCLIWMSHVIIFPLHREPYCVFSATHCSPPRYIHEVRDINIYSAWHTCIHCVTYVYRAWLLYAWLLYAERDICICSPWLCIVPRSIFCPGTYV